MSGLINSAGSKSGVIGEIIETGTNANGEYTKFKDGTLICKNDLQSNSSADVTWTFPHAFSGTGSRSGPSGHPACGGTSYDSADRWNVPGDSPFISTTSWKFRCWIASSSPGRSSSGQMLTAIGYWK